MKFLKKSVTIFTLIFILCNFFIAPISVISDELNAVDSYVLEIDSNVNAIDSKFNNYKGDSNYFNDAAYKYAIDKLFTDYQNKLSSFNTQKSNLVDSINLRDLLVLSNSTTLLNDFDEKGYNDQEILFDDIKDIYYYDSSLNMDVLFLTKTEVINLITDTFYSSYDLYFEDLNNNLDTYFNDIKSFYNVVNTDYVSLTTDIQGYITNASQYISDEEALGNVVDVNVEGSNVIALLNNYLNESSLIFSKVLEKEIYDNDFSLISTKALNAYNKFLENNKYYSDELLIKANDLILKYESYDSELENLYVSNSFDYTNIDYSLAKNLNSSGINQFINAFEKSSLLDSEYDALIEEISSYLDKKVSENYKFINVLDQLEVNYNKLNSDSIYSMYSGFVYNADFSSEDIIDLLLGYSDLEKVCSEYVYLMNKKELFYPIGLKDSSLYSASLKDNYFIISGASNIEKSSFENNIDYKYDFILKGENAIIDNTYEIELFDRNSNSLKTISIALKDDIDGNGIIDNNDVDLLKNKILSNQLSDYDDVVSDINEDSNIDINDLVLLDNKVNNKNIINVTKNADFSVIATNSSDKVIYNVYLKTDGVVRGLKFDINVSNNLRISDINSNNGISYNEKDNLVNFIGLGNYINNDLLVTITFDIINKENSNVILDNGSLVMETLQNVENINYDSVITLVETESSEDISNDGGSAIYQNETDDSEVKINEDNSLDDVSQFENKRSLDKDVDSSSDDGNDTESKGLSIWITILIGLVILSAILFILYFFIIRNDEE